jgi:hypothetical protein
MTEAEWVSGPDPAPLARFAGGRLTDRRRLLFMAGCCRRVWELFADPRFRAVIEVAEEVADGRATEADLAAAAEAAPRPGRPIELPPAWEVAPSGGPARRHMFRIGGGGAPYAPPGTYTANFRDLPVWCQQTYRAIAALPARDLLTVADACTAAAGHFAEDQVAARHPLHDEIRRLGEDVQRAYQKAEDYHRRGASGPAAEAAAAGRELEARADEQVGRLENEIWTAGATERVSRMAAERAAQAALIRCLVGNPFRPSAVDPRWLTSDVTDLARGIYAERAFDRLPILADALQDAGCGDEEVLSHCRGDTPHARGCWVVDSVLGVPGSGSA